jgi:hypothetical protein
MTQNDAIVCVLLGTFLLLVSLYGKDFLRPLGYGHATGKEAPVRSGRLFLGLLAAGFLVAGLKRFLLGK